MYSTEFDNLAKAYGISSVPESISVASGGTVVDFVKRFYSEVLGRTADEVGLNDWTSKLYSKEATGADIAIGFVFSQEFINRNTDDVSYLNILYKAFFNRNADEDGFNGWLDQLEQGVSRLDVLNGFLHSEEFINLCNGYGIIAYEGAPKYVLSSSTSENLRDDDTFFQDHNYTYTYDNRGNELTEIHSYMAYPNIKPTLYTKWHFVDIITSTYDTNNNVLSIKSENNFIPYNRNEVFTYDINNNLLTYEYDYTSYSRDLYSFDYTESHTLRYTYTTQNEKTTISVDGTVYNYVYDVNNRIISKPVWDGRDAVIVYQYTYDENGRMVSEITMSDSEIKTSSFEYDSTGNLIRKTYTRDAVDGSFFYRFTYSYDVKGNNTRLLSVYDMYNIDDMLKAYDSYGNILVSSRSSDGVEFSDKIYYNYSYDTYNNMISQTKYSDVKIMYEWIIIP